MWCPPVHVFSSTYPWYALCVNTWSVGSLWQNKALSYLGLFYTQGTATKNIKKFSKDNVTPLPLSGCLTDFLPPIFPHIQNDDNHAAFKITKIKYMRFVISWAITSDQANSLLAFSCPVPYYVSSWFLDPYFLFCSTG